MIIPLGYVKPTSSDEYKKAYRDLYEGQKEFAVVVRENGISMTGGVTKATDEADKMYSFERLKNFSGAIEQAEDITMLAVKFEGINLCTTTNPIDFCAAIKKKRTIEILNEIRAAQISVETRAEIFRRRNPAPFEVRRRARTLSSQKI